jgi:hypothetical protein
MGITGYKSRSRADFMSLSMTARSIRLWPGGALSAEILKSGRLGSLAGDPTWIRSAGEFHEGR